MTNQCLIDYNRIYTNFSMEGREVILAGRLYDTALTLDTLGEQWKLAFVYYILHRHYALTDAEKAAYYYNMHTAQMAKVDNRDMKIPSRFNLGTDL